MKKMLLCALGGSLFYSAESVAQETNPKPAGTQRF